MSRSSGGFLWRRTPQLELHLCNPIPSEPSGKYSPTLSQSLTWPHLIPMSVNLIGKNANKYFQILWVNLIGAQGAELSSLPVYEWLHSGQANWNWILIEFTYHHPFLAHHWSITEPVNRALVIQNESWCYYVFSDVKTSSIQECFYLFLSSSLEYTLVLYKNGSLKPYLLHYRIVQTFLNQRRSIDDVIITPEASITVSDCIAPSGWRNKLQFSGFISL